MDTTEIEEKDLNQLTIPEILEKRHELYLQWPEPWQACGPEGNPLDAHVCLSASVHDCINMERHYAKSQGRETMGEDGERLINFMAVHWARLIHKPQ